MDFYPLSNRVVDWRLVQDFSYNVANDHIFPIY